MIIICPCCEKKFEVDGNLIPEKGRTLQCGFCDQKWFFKNEEIESVEKTLKLNEISSNREKEITINEELDIQDNNEVNQIHAEVNNKGLGLNLSKILNYFIVSIITVVALIIFLDTFKYNLTSLFPNLELFLYNLYESIKDIKLFIYDLIK
tara:strand:- start:733 stop:1185 length:453 start_codon:yes stop_codon:yes gene_type:complete